MIGSHVCKRLHLSGYEVVGIYRKINDETALYPWEKWEVDLLSSKAALKLARIAPVKAVVHCAAILPSSFDSNEEKIAAQKNFSIDSLIISYNAHHKVRMIYPSGTSVYKSMDGVITENAPITPIGEYLAEKHRSEEMILQKVFEPVIMRICAPYASGQRARTVLKIFIENAVRGADLMYHGTGSRQQDFVHASDVAKMVALASDQTSATGIYNIAGGSPISMKQLAHLVIENVPGTSSNVVPSGLSDPQEDYRANFDISKAKAVFDWQPQTTLSQGIQHWVSYLKKNENRRNI